MMKGIFAGWRLRLLRNLLPDGGFALSGLRERINARPDKHSGFALSGLRERINARPDKRSAIGQLALCLFALILTGCSYSQKAQEGRPQAWLEPGTRVTLPAPGISPTVSVQQLLTGSFNGKTQSLLVMLNADDQKISLAGLSSVGIRLFLVTYDEKGLHTEQSLVVPQLPPASQVLADVMLSHWPVSAWQPELPKGWTLTDRDDKRELRNARGKLVTEITYLNRKGKREPISIEQHVFKYHITIQYLGD